MSAAISVTTARLLIEPLSLNDTKFMLELVNTDGWIRFIGNRNIFSEEAANAYIQRIIDNETITYWTVKLKTKKTKIGIITFIKRNYLEHPDIGFAFLPNFCNNGYAYEATDAILNNLISTHNLSHILATTIPENSSSIKLLKKLNFRFEKEMQANETLLHVYGISGDKN
ncbi:MAG: GNAT family N-acetyltransferase [Bacteroidia bacterium]